MSPTELPLPRFPFVSLISEASRRELARYRPKHAPPRTPLLERGDPVDGAFLVVGGSLRIFYLTPEGREATLYRVEPGETCILALTATFNRASYPAWVESGDQGVSFVVVPGEAFRRLFDAEPPFREFIFSVLSNRVFELMSTLEEAGSLRMEQRVARLLLDRAGADRLVRASQAAMAAELGTAREVVFRALRALAARGLIETGRLKIAIRDPDRLAGLVRAGEPAEA
jgi:CRP/FNR family transcriptional regulator